MHVESSRGFTLTEALVASLVLLVGLAGIAPLFGLSRTAIGRGLLITHDTLLAVEKLEELRHVAQDPGGSIAADVAGHYDVFDGAGRRLDLDSRVRPGHVRRWSVTPYTVGPVASLLLLEVRVVSDAGEVRVVALRPRQP